MNKLSPKVVEHGLLLLKIDKVLQITILIEKTKNLILSKCNSHCNREITTAALVQTEVRAVNQKERTGKKILNSTLSQLDFV